MDKKKETSRGSVREQEKVKKQDLKQAQLEVGIQRSPDNRLAVAAALITFYCVAMACIVDGAPSLKAPVPIGLTAALLGALAAAAWLLKPAKEEEVDAATLVKNTLERKQSVKERAEREAERRLRQQKELKERSKRRGEEEAASQQQMKELSRVLRARREQREAEEARAKAAEENADSSAVDVHGWTAKQYQELHDAAARYPEKWKKRWEVIAAEVKGQSAQACEEALPRLEAEAAEADLARARAKADRREAKATSSAGAGAVSLEDDLDWMGEVDATTAGGAYDESGEEEEELEEEEEVRERMAVELEPEHKGTVISLEGIETMQGIATVQLELLHLQLACADCSTASRVYLSGADEDATDAKTWCEGCSGLVAVRLRPTLLHRANSRLCYVDCVRCSVTDVLPSVLMSVCETCDAANVHKAEFHRNKIVNGDCISCHAKYAFRAESIRIEQVTPCDPGSGGRGAGSRRSTSSGEGDGDPMDEIAEELRYLRKKAKSDPRQQLIKLGSQLPQMGACRHFKKSYKWYRFSCCGRAFPCPECHVESGCPAAALGAHASRMICGKCSMEQTYNPARPCEKCNFSMRALGSAHWDDGAGTRNLTAMSTKDAKKFKGGLRQVNDKTKTSSKAGERVGVKAKAAREHVKKFGKDG